MSQLRRRIGYPPEAAGRLERIRTTGEGEILSGLLGSFVWVAANVAYCSYVRDGARGCKRFAAFWLGFPVTLISMFAVPHTKRIREPERSDLEEDHRLLLEIRRDRALREGQRQVPGRTDVATE